MTLEVRTIQLEGSPVRLHHRPGTPTALLLHGYPDTLHVFSRLVAALPREWGVIAADFPGQGESAPHETHGPDARARPAGW